MITSKNKLKNKKGGYTLIELVFYVTLFFVLSLAVINSMITMMRSFKETTVQSELGGSGAIMERMSREIRKAADITSIGVGDLKLTTTDDTGAAKIVEFLLSGPNVQLLENDALTGNLNSPNITVTALQFTQITTTEGKAVKMLLTVRSNNDQSGRTLDFYDTVVLRGSY